MRRLSSESFIHVEPVYNKFCGFSEALGTIGGRRTATLSRLPPFLLSLNFVSHFEIINKKWLLLADSALWFKMMCVPLLVYLSSILVFLNFVSHRLYPLLLLLIRGDSIWKGGKFRNHSKHAQSTYCGKRRQVDTSEMRTYFWLILSSFLWIIYPIFGLLLYPTFNH